MERRNPLGWWACGRSPLDGSYSNTVNSPMRALPFGKTSGPGGRPRRSRAPRNPFAEWIIKSKLKSDVIAARLEITVSAVYNLRNSYYAPGRELAVRIEEVTGGVVKVESWSDVKVRPRGKRQAA